MIKFSHKWALTHGDCAMSSMVAIKHKQWTKIGKFTKLQWSSLKVVSHDQQ